MGWKIAPTKSFLKELSRHRKDKAFVKAVNKKVERLQTDPAMVGGFLSGELHGYKSTRIVNKYRLIFRVDGETVWLCAIDHRGKVYE